jgi:hypothetical protein
MKLCHKTPFLILSSFLCVTTHFQIKAKKKAYPPPASAQ